MTFFKNHTATVIEIDILKVGACTLTLSKSVISKQCVTGGKEIKLVVYYQYILRPQQTIDAGNVEKVPSIYSPHLRKQHFLRICKLSKPVSRSKLNNDMGKSSQ